MRTPAKFEPPKKPVQFTPSPFQSAPVQESAPPKQIQELNSSTPLRDNDNSVYESPQPQPAAAMVSPQNTYVRDKFQYEGILDKPDLYFKVLVGLCHT